MGTHKKPWAIETIRQIKELGENLGYITAEDEMRITRGWVDVSWRWKAPILEDPLFLLIAEIETSKDDWPRIRSNAAKAVELKPLIYAHIFHPSIRLTNKELSQLRAIHHGRHVLIADGNTDFKIFLKRLAEFDQWYLRRELLAFCFVAVDKNYVQVRNSLSKIEGVAALYHLFGRFDFLLVLPLQNFKELNERIKGLHKIEGVRETTTIPAVGHLPSRTPTPTQKRKT